MIAVSGCTIQITTAGVTASSIVISTPASTTVFVDGKGVYRGTISVLLTTMQQGSFICASGTIDIEGTGDDVLIDGESAVLKDDTGNATFTFTDPGTGATMSINVAIKVSDAGQSNVEYL